MTSTISVNCPTVSWTLLKHPQTPLLLPKQPLLYTVSGRSLPGHKVCEMFEEICVLFWFALFCWKKKENQVCHRPDTIKKRELTALLHILHISFQALSSSLHIYIIPVPDYLQQLFTCWETQAKSLRVGWFFHCSGVNVRGVSTCGASLNPLCHGLIPCGKVN